jgi:hypothetical protein
MQAPNLWLGKKDSGGGFDTEADELDMPGNTMTTAVGEIAA